MAVGAPSAPLIELALELVQVGTGTEQRPAIASGAEHDDDQNPDGQNEQVAPDASQMAVQTTKPAADPPAPEACGGSGSAALRVLELGLLSGDGEVSPHRVKLALGLGFIDGLDAILELLGADPAAPACSLRAVMTCSRS